MALDLLVRRKQHKCCAVKHSVYFLIGELSSFLLQYLATERAATHTDAGLFQWEFGAFCSTFLLNFFTIQFLLVSLLSFWLYFSRWIVWTLLSSPLTALVCCSFFPCSYPLYLEWNLLWRSFEEMSFEIFCSCFVWSSSMSCTFDILLSAASVCTLHAGHFFLLSPFIAKEWALFSTWACNSLVTFFLFWGLKKCDGWMTSSSLFFLIWYLCC